MPVARAGGLEIALYSGPGSLAGITFEGFEVGRDSGRWSASLTGLDHRLTGPMGAIELACRADPVVCAAGTLAWLHPDDGRLEGRLARSTERLQVKIGTTAITLTTGPPMRLELGDLPLDWLPETLVGAWSLSYLAGRADLVITVRDETELDVRGSLAGLGFDTPDGLMAGEGLDLELELDWHPGRSPDADFKIGLVQSAGELLVGSLYLPPPDVPVKLDLSAHLPAAGEIEVGWFRLIDPGALELEGVMHWSSAAGEWSMQRIALNILGLEAGLARPRWLAGPIASLGFDDLAAGGRVSGELVWEAGRTEHLDLFVDDVDLDEQQGRFRVSGLAGTVRLEGDEVLEIDLAWTDAALLRVPLGSSRLQLVTGAPGRVELGSPLRVPILDGAFEVERFVWRDWRQAEVDMELDARIEPIDLGGLTDALDWPALGGTLSGRFPGIVWSEGVLAFAGGIDVNAFSGHIGISGLEIERLFGTLPALSGDVVIERLDLAELTGAFNFGHMLGRVSGHLRGLRLLDWSPVAFDARFETLEDVPRRRISQRAVDDFASLGGGMRMTGPLLGLFDNFSYRRVGIACVLANNICRMDGVAPHESGGYYIVEGRSLPRLDVIGHRRLVNWPLMVRQLITITQDS